MIGVLPNMVAAFGLATALLIATRAGAVESADACKPDPSFVALNSRVAAMGDATALRALYHYRSSNAFDPNRCDEGSAIDRLIDQREKKMIALVVDGRSIPPDAIYRCAEFDRLTTECNGVVADMTAHPLDGEGAHEPHPLGTASIGRIAAKLPQARLVGIYAVDTAALVRGDRAAARPMPTNAAVRLPKALNRRTIVGIFAMPTQPKHIKAVWYLR